MIYQEGSDALPALGIGAAAAAGLGLLAFTEIETALQLLGSAVLVQLLSKKLLFVEEHLRLGKSISVLHSNVEVSFILSTITSKSNRSSRLFRNLDEMLILFE